MPPHSGRTAANRGVSHAPLWLLIGGALFIGIVLHRDFGIAWDEVPQRDYGKIVFENVTAGSDELYVYRDRYYGPIVEFAFYAAERGLGLTDSQQIFFLRHLLTFLVFLAGVLFFGLLMERQFRHSLAGVAGAAMLLVSPVPLGHAFYNSKDIPFMAAWTAAYYTLFRMLDSPRQRWVIAHALASAVLITTRVVGVFVPAVTCGALLVPLVRDARPWRAVGLRCALYLVLTAQLSVLFWPTLWASPIFSFWEALTMMGRYPWPLTTLYMGEFVPAVDVPWHYLPVWIGITTPPLIVLGCLGGLSLWTARAVRRPADMLEDRSWLLFLWLAAPLAAIVLFGSTLYDGWRHVLFLYPAMLFFALYGYVAVLRALRRLRPAPLRTAALLIFWTLAAAQVTTTAAFMVRNHPYHHVYFNAFAGGVAGAKDRFELDYWGLSYREAFEYLLARNPDGILRVRVNTFAGRFTLNILPPEARRRIVLTDAPAEADYFLTDFRWHAGGDDLPVVHSVLVDGVPILSIYDTSRPTER